MQQRQRISTYHQQSSGLFQKPRQLSGVSLSRQQDEASSLPENSQQFVSSPDLRHTYYYNNASKNSQSPDKNLSKLLPTKVSISPNRARPSFSYFHLKRMEPSNSLAAMHMKVQRQLTGRLSSGIRSQATLLQERPLSQQLKQPGVNTEERRSRDQQQMNQQQHQQQRQQRMTMQVVSNDFSRTQEGVVDNDYSSAVEDDEESDSCEANADECESVKLSDDFDQGENNPVQLLGGVVAPRNRYHNEQASLRWDYFPDEDRKSSYESHLDEHDQDGQPSSEQAQQQRHFQSSPIIEQERRGQERVKTVVSRLQHPGANLCELLRSKQQDKPTFVKQSSKGSLELQLQGKQSPGSNR